MGEDHFTPMSLKGQMQTAAAPDKMEAGVGADAIFNGSADFA